MTGVTTGRVTATEYVDTFTPPLREPWMDEGACQYTDPEIFFESPNAADAPAKKVCLGDKATNTPECPVRQTCLVWTLLTEKPKEQRYGFFGGLGPADRATVYDALKEKNIV